MFGVEQAYEALKHNRRRSVLTTPGMPWESPPSCCCGLWIGIRTWDDGRLQQLQWEHDCYLSGTRLTSRRQSRI